MPFLLFESVDLRLQEVLLRARRPARAASLLELIQFLVVLVNATWPVSVSSSRWGRHCLRFGRKKVAIPVDELMHAFHVERDRALLVHCLLKEGSSFNCSKISSRVCRLVHFGESWPSRKVNARRGSSFMLLETACLPSFSSLNDALWRRLESLEYWWRASTVPLRFFAIFLRVLSRDLGIMTRVAASGTVGPLKMNDSREFRARSETFEGREADDKAR